jgi:hypothetical protein
MVMLNVARDKGRAAEPQRGLLSYRTRWQIM